MDIITYALLKKKIKDLEEELKSRGKYVGVTTSPLVEGSTTNPILVNGEEVLVKSGDWTMVDGTEKEFAFNGTIWQEFGDISNLDYEDLLNLPSVNGVELVGNKTFEDLGREDIRNSRIKQIIDTQYDLIFGDGGE